MVVDGKPQALQLERIVPTQLQIQILYDLLKARHHRISHAEMPDFETHRDFVEAHPYRVWYLVVDGQDPIGSLYVGKDNAIGINLVRDPGTAALGEVIDRVMGETRPLPPIASVRAGYFFVNVPSGNTQLMRQLAELGFDAIQTSFMRRPGSF